MKKSFLLMMVIPLIFASCSNGDKVGYKGADLSGRVEVERDKRTKEASVVVNTGQDWKIYAGPAVDEIDMQQPVLTGTSNGTFSLPVSNSSRSYFQFVSGNDGAILAERHLPMEGGYNFRDLGGYRTKNGHHVKWGKIFRSDDLHSLTQSDLSYLASIPIISVVDFRSQEEVQMTPDVLPSGATRYELSITPGNVTDIAEFMNRSQSDMREYMKQMNVAFVTQPEFVEKYREFFALLQSEQNIPLMFHCSAGKDRTGMGAALILLALGVDEETVMNDYLASNDYLGDKYGDIVRQFPNLQPMMVVDRDYLQAGLDRIKSDHGSVENFLRDQLNVNIDNFRDMYLWK